MRYSMQVVESDDDYIVGPDLQMKPAPYQST